MKVNYVMKNPFFSKRGNTGRILLSAVTIIMLMFFLFDFETLAMSADLKTTAFSVKMWLRVTLVSIFEKRNMS